MQTGPSGGNYNYTTEGAKASLTDWGNPSTNDNIAQHVLVHLSSVEQDAHCNAKITYGYLGCWIQTGWITGQIGKCPSGAGTTGNAIDVYVEIFDDTTAPCLEGTFGTPTSSSLTMGRSGLPGMRRYR